MKIEYLNENFSISDQLSIEDVASLSSVGVRTIVCNWSDNEVPDQVSFKAVSDEAAKCGIHTHHIDFAPKGLSEDIGESFKAVFDSDKRVHAYCRTGVRSKMIFDAMK